MVGRSFSLHRLRALGAGLRPRTALGEGLRPRRLAFTLIELMVVMILILVLGGITVIFFPGINEQARAARGGVTLQGYFAVAKQRALRDQAPRGLRLFIGTSNPNIITTCQYIEQPDDFTGSSLMTDSSDPSLMTVLVSVDLTGGSINPEEWSAKPGDYLEVLGGGLMHKILSITPAAGATSIKLASPMPFSIGATTNYRIVRSPRVSGDELLDFPDQVGIDISTNGLYGNPLPIAMDLAVPPNKYIDVLFSPAGDVITAGIVTASLNFWVRDISDLANTNPFSGDPSIIAVYVRSGFVAAHPPAPAPNFASPYAFIDDGRSSGK